MVRYFLAAILLAAGAIADAREWSDATGKYKIDADLVANDGKTAIIQTKDRRLLEVELDKLAEPDRKYLASEDAQKATSTDGMQTWTLGKKGWQVRGKVVAYGRRELVIRRQGAKEYINDRLYENLPPIYKQLIPKIVSHFVNMNVETEEQFLAWCKSQGTRARRFTCDGVMLELENGDRYAVPFFFFSDADLAVLKPGWERWLAAAQDSESQNHEDYMLSAQAQAYQNDPQMVTPVQKLELSLLATATGIVSIWEVAIAPGPGVAGYPTSVVVPARDSRAATEMALSRYPGYVAGPVRRL